MVIECERNIMGIDIGSVSIAVIEMTPTKKIVKGAYLSHKGKPAEKLTSLLAEFDLSGIGVYVSTASTPDNIQVMCHYDNQLALIAAARHFHNKPGSILHVGGEKFGLIFFDREGNYSKSKTNTSCAAGTGSFLDQQALRLNLGNIDELCEIAKKNQGDVPKIATRCAVFAKTDLIHAQQEGYSLAEISDGLCLGLAKNIVDTLFSGEEPNEPIIFCGGVSKNLAVANYIRSLIRKDMNIDNESHLYGAIGAVLLYLDDVAQGRQSLTSGTPLKDPAHIISLREKKKGSSYKPLSLKLSTYPDFRSWKSYIHHSRRHGLQSDVEVDIYHELIPGKSYPIYLGIDIGSTSTKAVLMEKDKTVLAGLYTRTAGKPLDALRAIFEAIDHIRQDTQIEVVVLGAGTTGSGRKFAGRIINADLVLDEITAHARAAVELNPKVDTIIEIGGQDSKFTTLKDGRVTFSVMNHVCAAGTGSFIEEQALKLGISLSDYSGRAENTRAPMSSDRCTVFMERDINHYLSEGYTINEVLASVLHSVRDNYLLKVAIESNIGDVVFFQGATAKNKALVAAFEQRLQKPLLVSRYCHLTGALGTSLSLQDESLQESVFRGFDFYKHEIAIRSETCSLCNNHCKITIADIEKEAVAYGFLCGRDYDTKQYVNNNISGFDLLRERNRVLSAAAAKRPGSLEINKNITIGIPAALYLFEDLTFWQQFFNSLSVHTITSEKYKTAVKAGKHLTGAEFCAPVMAMHGHTKYLLGKADYIFLPYYLENKESIGRRQYCYFSQYVPSLIATMGIDKERILMPIVRYLYTTFHTKMQLYKSLHPITGKSFLEISSAYDSALEFKKTCLEKYQESYIHEVSKTDDISVIFLGRPYTILSASDNKKIPQIFASLGIKTFFQDMLPISKEDIEPIADLLGEVHWNYASDILIAANKTVNTGGVYPVFVTSFKCAPDAFITEFFKKIMDAAGKPYLILELDEHGSSVGYETRIEAAVRAFRNHHQNQKNTSPKPAHVKPPIERNLSGKTIILPNWDSITNRLLAANLRREGINALLMTETEKTIRRSLKYNTGQCIPLNAVTEGFIDCIQRHELDPAKTVLWMMKAETCSLKLFPHYIKELLRRYGNGMEKAGVYTGEISFIDFSLRAAVNAYFAFLLGGLLRRLGCRIRPYEKEAGLTDATILKSLDILLEAFEGRLGKEEAVAEVVSYFEDIAVEKTARPKVAIFGDIYARDNDVLNQDLIHYIEALGGEVITTPYTDYCKMIAARYFRKWFTEGKYLNVLSYKALLTMMRTWEKTYYKYFEKLLNEPDHEFNDPSEKILSEYSLVTENTGESMDSILKIFYIKKYHPDLSLLVQASPAFCCPSLVTEAMANEIEKKTGVPVVSITYDGIGGDKNQKLIPYLKYPRRRIREKDSRPRVTHFTERTEKTNLPANDYQGQNLLFEKA